MIIKAIMSQSSANGHRTLDFTTDESRNVSKQNGKNLLLNLRHKKGRNFCNKRFLFFLVVSRSTVTTTALTTTTTTTAMATTATTTATLAKTTTATTTAASTTTTSTTTAAAADPSTFSLLLIQAKQTKAKWWLQTGTKNYIFAFSLKQFLLALT